MDRATAATTTPQNDVVGVSNRGRYFVCMFCGRVVWAAQRPEPIDRCDGHTCFFVRAKSELGLL